MKRREQPRHANPAASAPAERRYPRAESGTRERAIRTNVGFGSTRFVGRRRELSELRTMLAERPIATVAGAPGIGKTRLASELARALYDEYAREGGVWRVDLASASGGDEVLAAVARTLSARAEAIGTALDARGRTLIVLDAVDACAVDVARALGAWVRAAPGVRWIATARERLGLEGEAVLTLGPMATSAPGGGASDAEWLYFDRARAARPGITIEEGALGDVRALARRLEGVPLAIEIAAGLGEIASAGSLEAILRHAWEALGACGRDALAQMSLLAGAFDAEAARAVVDLSAYADAPTIEHVLADLRARGLVASSISPVEPSTVRFSLHAVVREFARARLDEGAGRDACLLRYARHHVARGLAAAERREADGSRETLASLARAADDLVRVHRRMIARGRAGAALALGAAVAIDPLLASTGPVALRLRLLDAALSAAEREGVDASLRVRGLEARCDANGATDRWERAALDARDALSLAASAGVRDAVPRVLAASGAVAVAQGRYAEARVLLERARAAAVRAGARRDEGRALACIGRIEASEGALDRARAMFARAAALHRETRDAPFEASGALGLAGVERDSGRLLDARLHAERAAALARQMAHASLEGEALGLLALLAHEEARADVARDLGERAIALHRECGDRRGEAGLLRRIGACTADRDSAGARAAYGRALPVLREAHDRCDEALLLAGLAAIEAHEGGIASARATLARAAECVDSGDDIARAAIEIARGSLDAALARAARREGDEGRADVLLAAARRRLQAATPSSADLRLATRTLRNAIESAAHDEPDVSAPPSPILVEAAVDASADVLVVCAHGRWFRVPGGDVVSVARWRPLQRMLERLAERREIAPGEASSVDALVNAGWPGERMIAKAGATRVYTAIASLRRLGLRDVLVREDAGYRFTTDVPLVRVSGR